VEPAPSAFREREDFFGNRVCYFSVQQPHDVLAISVTSSVGLAENDSPVDFSASLPWEEAKRRLREENAPETMDARQFAFDSPMVSTSRELSEYAGLSFSKGRPILEACNDLMGRIYREFEFTSGFTTVSTPLAYVMEHRKGVCQDFTHLAVGCLRSLGLAARYVSGYIETLPPPGKEKLKGADVSHAWFSAFAPGIGWIDFDPTNNLIPADRHVVTAWGRDFSDVTPVKGIVFSGGGHRLSVFVDVERS
jgi:transglutaminase-like putative cysteine protease